MVIRNDYKAGEDLGFEAGGFKMEGKPWWVRTLPLDCSVLLLSLFLLSLQGFVPTSSALFLPGFSLGWLTLDGSLSLNLPFAFLCNFIHNRTHFFIGFLQEVNGIVGVPPLQQDLAQNK